MVPGVEVKHTGQEEARPQDHPEPGNLQRKRMLKKLRKQTAVASKKHDQKKQKEP